MLVDQELKAKMERARAAHRERGAKPNGKVLTGRGIGLYAEDFTNEERSAVADELSRTGEAQPAGR